MQINHNHTENPMGLSFTNDNVKKVLNVSAEFVNTKCHQLFKNTPIKYFGYYRYHDSGLMSAYVSNPFLTVDLMQEDLMPRYEDIYALDKNGVRSTYLSHCLSPPEGMKNVDLNKFMEIISRAADHGSYNALVVMDRFEDYYRYCIFAVETTTLSIFNFYINYFSQLKAFIKYFENISQELFLAEDSTTKIVLPNYNLVNTKNDFAQISLQGNGFDFLSQVRGVDSLRLDLVTNREKDCLSLIARGFTMKNAAKKLNISHRTVEQHLRNVKEKLQLNTKNQLVEAWYMFKDED